MSPFEVSVPGLLLLVLGRNEEHVPLRQILELVVQQQLHLVVQVRVLQLCADAQHSDDQKQHQTAQ